MSCYARPSRLLTDPQPPTVDNQLVIVSPYSWTWRRGLLQLEHPTIAIFRHGHTVVITLRYSNSSNRSTWNYPLGSWWTCLHLLLERLLVISYTGIEFTMKHSYCMRHSSTDMTIQYWIWPAVTAANGLMRTRPTCSNGWITKLAYKRRSMRRLMSSRTKVRYQRFYVCIHTRRRGRFQRHRRSWLNNEISILKYNCWIIYVY